MINPNELYNKLDIAIDEYSQATYEFKMLDNTKKSVLARLTLEQDGRSQSEKETKALASDEYVKFCEGLAEAERKYIKARFKVQNMMAYQDNVRTVEVSNRQAVK